MSKIHFEWGEQALAHLRDQVDVFVIVDVLSFTTCVDVAVSRGALIYPYRWNDYSSQEFARRIGGMVGVSTRQPGYSLSPASLEAIEPGTRLVLPSPNGSTLSTMTQGRITFAGCLRNAAAVAAAAQRSGERIGVVASGERWKDGSLRPAVEDLLGAGAIFARMVGEKTIEAELAERLFLSVEMDLPRVLAGCMSGQELLERGRARDVELAAAINASHCAQQLVDGAFMCAT
ncbi:MAG: 2-phosphosulfolactate phosphatase [Anaerolineae bacterium]|nr:2-phosphosulfolactate phosphatase [Anaerolineae bacterium]